MPGDDVAQPGAAGVWSPPPVLTGGDSVGAPPRPDRPVSRMRSLAWFGIGAALPVAVLLFPVGLLVLPALVIAVALLCTRAPVWPEVLGLGFGLSAMCAAAAYGNTFRPDCPPSGVRRIGPDEFASCFASVLFRVDVWAGLSALLLLGSLALTAAAVVQRRQDALTS